MKTLLNVALIVFHAAQISIMSPMFVYLDRKPAFCNPQVSHITLLASFDRFHVCLVVFSKQGINMYVTIMSLF